VNAFIKLARAHKLRLYSTTKGAFYNLDKASGRKELRDDTSEAVRGAPARSRFTAGGRPEGRLAVLTTDAAVSGGQKVTGEGG
jgi:hypothetical protein